MASEPPRSLRRVRVRPRVTVVSSACVVRFVTTTLALLACPSLHTAPSTPIHTSATTSRTPARGLPSATPSRARRRARARWQPSPGTEVARADAVDGLLGHVTELLDAVRRISDDEHLWRARAQRCARCRGRRRAAWRRQRGQVVVAGVLLGGVLLDRVGLDPTNRRGPLRCSGRRCRHVMHAKNCASGSHLGRVGVRAGRCPRSATFASSKRAAGSPQGSRISPLEARRVASAAISKSRFLRCRGRGALRPPSSYSPYRDPRRLPRRTRVAVASRSTAR